MDRLAKAGAVIAGKTAFAEYGIGAADLLQARPFWNKYNVYNIIYVCIMSKDYFIFNHYLILLIAIMRQRS